MATALLLALAAVYAGSLVFVVWLVWWTVGHMKQRNTAADGRPVKRAISRHRDSRSGAGLAIPRADHGRGG